MTLELTKSNRKYLALLEAVDAAKAREAEALLSYNLRKAATAEAREAVTKFEGKHGGETLLKPYIVPVPHSNFAQASKLRFYDLSGNVVAQQFSRQF